MVKIILNLYQHNFTVDIYVEIIGHPLFKLSLLRSVKVYFCPGENYKQVYQKDLDRYTSTPVLRKVNEKKILFRGCSAVMQ